MLYGRMSVCTADSKWAAAKIRKRRDTSKESRNFMCWWTHFLFLIWAVVILLVLSSTMPEEDHIRGFYQDRSSVASHPHIRANKSPRSVRGRPWQNNYSLRISLRGVPWNRNSQFLWFSLVSVPRSDEGGTVIGGLRAVRGELLAGPNPQMEKGLSPWR